MFSQFQSGDTGLTMTNFKYISSFVLSLLIPLCSAQSVDLATVSITSAAAFQIAPACVQSCVFYNSFDVADYLLAALGCTRLVFKS